MWHIVQRGYPGQDYTCSFCSAEFDARWGYVDIGVDDLVDEEVAVVCEKCLARSPSKAAALLRENIKRAGEWHTRWLDIGGRLASEIEILSPETWRAIANERGIAGEIRRDDYAALGDQDEG